MDSAYYLIVERHVDGQRLRTLDECGGPDELVRDAADYEAGEYPGRWVGALELSFDASGRLTAASPVDDIAAGVHAELRDRTDWRRRQTALDRWAAG